MLLVSLFFSSNIVLTISHFYTHPKVLCSDNLSESSMQFRPACYIVPAYHSQFRDLGY